MTDSIDSYVCMSVYLIDVNTHTHRQKKTLEDSQDQAIYKQKQTHHTHNKHD